MFTLFPLPLLFSESLHPYVSCPTCPPPVQNAGNPLAIVQLTTIMSVQLNTIIFYFLSL